MLRPVCVLAFGFRSQVVHLPRSGGVVRRDVNTRRKDISRGYRNYFYGTNSELNPFTIVVDFADVTLLRVGGGPAVPASALPIGAESTLDPLRIAHVTIQTDLIRSILGVSQAKEEQDVPNSALAGYVHVTKVDTLSSSYRHFLPILQVLCSY